MKYESKLLPTIRVAKKDGTIQTVFRAEVLRDGAAVFISFGESEDDALSRADSLAASCNTSVGGDTQQALICAGALIDLNRPDECKFLLLEVAGHFEAAFKPLAPALTQQEAA